MNLSDRAWSIMPHLNLACQAFKLSQTYRTGNKEFLSQPKFWWKELLKKVWMMYWLCFSGSVPGRGLWKCPLAKDIATSPIWTKHQSCIIKPTAVLAFQRFCQRDLPIQKGQVEIFRFLWLFLKSYLGLKYDTQ